MNQSTYLFVYGTLKPDAEHPMGARLSDGATHVGAGHIQACLYLIDDPEEAGNTYPGAVPSGYPNDRVYGEVYTLHAPDTLLPVFDVYEACDPSRPEPHEFLRRSVPVTLSDGNVQMAVCYCYAWDLSQAKRIASGRFTDLARNTK